MSMPKDCFEKFMEPIQDGDAKFLRDDQKALSRDPSTGAVLPTKESAQVNKYEFIIYRPMVVDRLLQLEQADLKLGPLAKPGKAGKPWRRGMGCSKLVLADNARGRQGFVISTVAGNVVITYKEPKAYRAMPTLTLRFFVFSMDEKGHVEWPANFTNNSKALLRKLGRNNLRKMLDSAEYPVSPQMEAAMKAASSTVLTRLRASANDPRHESEA